ncbi:hypothetical protein yc1106_01871 [Curvularia clavata]|uniref:Uncharacterized protein n=1 Tax=Curvularia clavata TaxID=95742 RepID=A0A9Q8Z2L5_CURCL|nr:hypothetical protein yc1106_01871 [Curvularia clavata]
MEAGTRPDLVVSIDFGTTCTGVAYANVATGSDRVWHIQRWPGRAQAEVSKVPSLLVYPKGSHNPPLWGFGAETALEQGSVTDADDKKDWFKILLDENLLERMRTKDPHSNIPSTADVERWTCDYFQSLYRSIEAKLRGELACRWEDARIEFIFSVPTTWNPHPTVERFRNIAVRAGFEKSPNHSVIIGLTEAEAAAVHTAKNMPGLFKENDILLVCDIGGGTTDLSVLRVKGTNQLTSSLSLEQIDVVFGATIGAARLDSLFEQAVLDRLIAADKNSPLGLPDLTKVAWSMRMSKQYQNAKCEYGTEESFTEENFYVPIPELSKRYANAEYGISEGDMMFRRDELKPFFDAQTSKLFDLIEKQLGRIRQKFPSEQVAHMVLSGGLGNSAYVQSALRDRYAPGPASFANAQNLQIRVAPDPQLVVCKGNVADRLQKLKNGEGVLKWRCCRTSYGTLCKTLYDPKNPAHQGLRTKLDPFDGKVYVLDHIDWFIKKSQPVATDRPIVRHFRRKCAPATAMCPEPTRVFPDEIVCSDVDGPLPLVMNNLCRSICKIESDFSAVPLSNFKLKNRHWWNTGKKYHRIEFVVKVIMGPASMSFELWHQGIRVNKENSIKVEWHPSSPPPPSEPVDADLLVSSLAIKHFSRVKEEAML